MTTSYTFNFKPFEEMTEADYAEIGFKCGLEIHQQLLTKRKLFCRCPAGKYSTEVDAEMLRHMRPTLSELGEYDGTALMEFKTKKEIIYLLNKQSVCTYEMDDAPPFEIDPQAVDIALEVALLLDLNLVSELHIARKQYLDGSIPAGFQRTTLLGVDGEIEVMGKKVGIIQLGLEEDSCREVSDIGHRITFRTDRLGMPLIETVTYPVLYTPQMAAEAANVIRQLVRATGKVRVGRGAARQDVNVSVTGGTRIEIKGVPSIKHIPHLVYNEAMRQYNLLKISEILKSRGLDSETFETNASGVTNILYKTTYVPVAHAIENGGVVGAVKLKGFAGIMAHQTQEHTYFAQEISDRVKVIACLMDHPNILHSDSTSTGISRGQWNRIRKRLRANLSEDAIVLVWGEQADVRTAIEEIVIRAKDAIDGVPPETRQALRDGTNGFERILPGADRMYPDTDMPPLSIEDDKIDQISQHLPEKPWERHSRLLKYELNEQMIALLIRSSWWSLFDGLIKRCDCNPTELANLITRDFRYFKRKSFNIERINEDTLSLLYTMVEQKRILKEVVPYILHDLVSDEKGNVDKIIDHYSKKQGDEKVLEEMIEEATTLQHELLHSEKSSRMNYLMGFVMRRMRGSYPATLVKARLEEVVRDGK